MFKKGQIGIYIHWPFCVSKCPYCDFNVFTSTAQNLENWTQRYIQSIAFYAAKMPGREVVSLYFGGGTPSLMEPWQVEKIIRAVQAAWSCAEDLEITLEANPTSSEIDKFKSFRQAGVNRLSLGVQSFDDQALQFLGRLHKAEEVRRALEVTKKVFPRYSLDLIYDQPGQSLEDWRAQLEEAMRYDPGHISAYQLTIKEGTAFEKQVERSIFEMPNEESSTEQFLYTQEYLKRAGLPAYEISNYGRGDDRSKHNMMYWFYQDYIGIGPGAHGRVSFDGQKYATQDHRKPEQWLECVSKNGIGAEGEGFAALSEKEQFEEAFIMGMRLYQGRSLRALADLCVQSWQEMIDQKNLEIACENGWMTFDPDTAYLTFSKEGMLRNNALTGYLLK